MASIEYRPYAEKAVTAGGWVAMIGIGAFFLGFFFSRKPI